MLGPVGGLDSGLLAVLSGDLVGSTELADRIDWPREMARLFGEIGAVPGWLVRPLELYRGDSFQGIATPDQALAVALAVRSGLRALEGRGPGLAQRPDARISIGIGPMEALAERAGASNGEAARLSGRGLDQLTREGGDHRLALAGPSGVRGELLGLAVRFADELCSRWTQASAEVVHWALVRPGWTQAQVAAHLGVSQPAVSQRLKAARWGEVVDLVAQFARAAGGGGR